MRTSSEIKEQITLAIIEEINRVGFRNLTREPENAVPKFIEKVSNRLTELCLDEIHFGR